jgi:hypothetical protein
LVSTVEKWILAILPRPVMMVGFKQIINESAVSSANPATNPFFPRGEIKADQEIPRDFLS